jgi:hypothetical protein
LPNPIKGFPAVTNKTLDKSYERPTLKVLGTLHELTLAECVDKTWGSADGHTMMGVSIRCSSA